MANAGSEFKAIKIGKPQSPPKDLTNPNNRTAENYLLLAQNFYYMNFEVNSGKYISYLKIQEWITNRLISQGKSDEGLLLDKIFGKVKNERNMPQETQAEEDFRSFINLDWERLKFWPQLRDQVISRIEEVTLDMTCNAINPEAGDEKENIKWQLWMQAQNAKYIAEMEALAQIDLGQNPDTPMPINNRQDLEMFMKSIFKHDFEVAMQVAVKSALNGGDMPWSSIKKMHIEDIVDIGRFMVDTITNPIDHTTQSVYVDPVNSVVPEFRGHILDDPSQIAYFKTYSAADLMRMIDIKLTNNQKIQIYDMYKNNWGNTTMPNGIQSIINTDAENGFWTTFNVPVMKMYFQNSDRLKFAEVEGNLGKKFRITDKEIGTREYLDYSTGTAKPKKEEVKEYNLQYYEQLHWVIGTDIVYDYGKVVNQAREIDQASKAICPLITYVVNTASFTDRIRAFDEAANIAWLKMQQAKASARPSGVSIDIAAVSNIEVDGKVGARFAVKFFNATGNLLWTSQNQMSPEVAAQYKPIQTIEGGLGRDYDKWLQDLHFNLDSMMQVIGFNEITSGATPEARTGKGIADLAVQGTQYSLRQIVDGLITTYSRMCETMAQKIQWQVRNGDIEITENALGKTITHILGMNVVLHRFAFQWKVGPTEQQKSELKDAAKQALINTADPMKGGINYSDYFYLCDMIDGGVVDFKFIQLVFGYIVERNIQRQTQQQQQTAQAQAQGNMQADQQKAQFAAQQAQTAHQYKMEEINLEGQWELQNTQMKGANSVHHAEVKSNSEQQHTILEKSLETVSDK